MSIDVEINGRNLEITDRIRQYIDTKVSKLDRFLPEIEEARVDLSYVKSARSATDRQVAQITVRGRGFILRSEERADDIFAALDVANDKIQRRIEKFKGKRYRGRGDGTPVSSFVMEGEMYEEETGELGPAIVRRKKFMLPPMDEIEALEQMELLGHENFFIFFNINSNSINVLYRRRDGNFGLIEPEIG